jgi:hypothetical protein
MEKPSFCVGCKWEDDNCEVRRQTYKQSCVKRRICEELERRNLIKAKP